jgi:hypothetical protein
MSRQSWRSVELTSLEIATEKELQQFAQRAKLTRAEFLQSCGRNFIVPPSGDNGRYIVLTNTYKTVGKYQTLEDTLVPEVGKAVGLYINRFRKVLLGGQQQNQDHHFAFVGPTGRALTGSDIADLFERLTGIRLLCNVRRKATVTWALSQPNMDRESLARLMRHSQKQQQQTYDKRTNDVQTSAALISIEGFAERLHKKQSRQDSSTDGAKAVLGDVVKIGNGAFGKVVERIDTAGGPKWTLLTLVAENGESRLKPIFGDSLLLQCHSVFQFALESEVAKLQNVVYDDKSDVYVIQKVKRVTR